MTSLPQTVEENVNMPSSRSAYGDAISRYAQHAPIGDKPRTFDLSFTLSWMCYPLRAYGRAGGGPDFQNVVAIKGTTLGFPRR
eukprot:317894-Amphidinium_carterae.2